MCLATPAKVKKVKRNTALVDFGGVFKEISLGILSGIKEGEYVLVHAGFAIARVKETEAQDSLKALQELKSALRDERF